MRMLKRQSKLIVVLLSLLLIVSCAKKQLQLKPEEEKDRAYYEHLLAHAQATQKYAEAAMKYNLHVKAADPETKAFFVKEVDPLWVQSAKHGPSSDLSPLTSHLSPDLRPLT